jgi:hypothetical protein
LSNGFEFGLGESWNIILHNIKNDSIASSYTNNNNKLIIFSNNSNNKIDNYKWRGQRAIGVVYNLQYERYGNYVPTNISLIYNAFLFIDETHTLNPLHMQTINERSSRNISYWCIEKTRRSILFIIILFL